MNKIVLTVLLTVFAIGTFAQPSNRQDRKQRKLELKEVRCPRHVKQ